MPPRILFLDHVGALGGAELTLIEVARAFREGSTFVLFEDGPFRHELEASGIKVELVPGGAGMHSVRRETGWPGLKVAWETFQLARRLVPIARAHDIILAGSQKAFVVACVLGKLSGKQVLWGLNDLMVPEHFSPLNIKLGVWLARFGSARVVVNSEATARAFIAQGGPRKKVHVVYNGIDPRPFDDVSDEEVAAVRGEFGFGRAPIAGLFGRLTEWKGQRTALRALQHLPDVQLLVVGDALFGEHDYAEGLRKEALAMGLMGRVRFTGFRSDIPRLMRGVDLVLHTSTSPEPFGRVIVEGMLARRPVVAAKGGGVEEVLCHDETGEVVTPGDPDALAVAIHRLLSETARTERMVIAARRVAETRFSVDTMIRTMGRQMLEVALQ